MNKKVSLNVFISPQVRLYIKTKAANEGVTMAALLERIVVEWGKF